MKLKFKNFLALLAVAISIFSYAQTPTLIASGTYKANGSGTSGIPTVSINIPAGKNRVMIISTFSERVHSTFNSNFVYNTDGATNGDGAHPIFVNGVSGTFLSVPTQMGSTYYGVSPLQYVGESVDLSADGFTMAVGQRNSLTTNTNQFVKIFKWNSATSLWDLKGSPILAPNQNSVFGCTVTLTDDGNTVAIGDYALNQSRGAVYILVFLKDKLI